MTERQQVVVVTGGGGGIGAAIAEELGRRGRFVVTVDPLVTVDGAEQLPQPEETTAGRIVAAGGSAQASAISVTDTDAVRALFDALAAEHGGVDGVVNVAGITRPTGFATGTEEDWAGVLAVHLGGYLNVLGAALPVMAAARRGRIVGVTSGSGWRPADAGAYSCAKRAVAALTWQLGRVAPAGVSINAMSPIAATRMVAAALARVGGGSGGAKASGGLSLSSMPQPEELGPLGAHMADESFAWCNGRIVFAGGSEVALVEEPGLLEVLRTDGVASLGAVLDAVLPVAWVAAEASQASGGGSNPRFGDAFSADEVATSSARSCLVVADHPEVAKAVTAALEARGVNCRSGELGDDVDAIVVAPAGPASSGSGDWEAVLVEHAGLVGELHADARWARAAADLGRPVRLVTLTDARTSGGRSRGQVAAQLARAGRKATGDLVTPFAVSVEGDDVNGAAELAAHLVCHPDAVGLAGAELVAGDGWIGLRSHPRPTGAIVLDGPELPPWFEGALREIAR